MSSRYVAASPQPPHPHPPPEPSYEVGVRPFPLPSSKRPFAMGSCPPSKVGQLRWVCLRPAPVPGTGDGVQASDHASRKTSLTAPPSLLSQNISPSKPLQATKHRIPTHRHTDTPHTAQRTTHYAHPLSPSQQHFRPGISNCCPPLLI